MGFSLGSIVSDITSLVSDPGKLVSEVADAILPSNMKAIGDAIGGIVDLNTGHPLQALSHLSDSLKDLPQLMGQSGAAAKVAATPAGTAAAEPSPPPARSLVNVAKQAVGSNVTVSVNLGGGQTLTLSENISSAAANAPSGKSPAPPSSSSTPTGAPAANGSTGSLAATTVVSTPATATPSTSTTTATDSTPKTGSSSTSSRASSLTDLAKQAIGSAQPSITLSMNLDGGQKFTISETMPSASQNAASGKTSTPPSSSSTGAPAANGSTGSVAAISTAATTPASPTPASATPASATPASAAPASAAPSTGTTATDPTTKTGSAGATSSLASLMAMSPDQFMQAVTSGQIPPDVGNDQSAMMQVQARMNSITQMNQLVTSMMSAMHQMQMSIIQNIRC